jgi:hypothetical protein
MEFEVPRTQWGTPPGIMLDKLSVAYSDIKKENLQHVALLQVDALKTKAFGIIPFVDKIGVPSRPKGVSGANLVVSFKSTDYDPIFASLENHHHRP